MERIITSGSTLEANRWEEQYYLGFNPDAQIEYGAKHTIIRDSSLSDVAKLIEKVWNFPSGTCTEASTQACLHIFGTELSEGFFSHGIILVEGVTDKFALQTVARHMGKSLAENNIAILPVSGKGNIDKPWMVFTQLKIPVYPVWDADEDCAENDKEQTTKTNKALQRMVNIQDKEIIEFPSGTKKNYASFNNDLEHQLKADFGEDDYNAALQEALKQFGLSAKQGKKNPYVVSDTIRRLYESGKKSSTLESIIAAAFLHIFPKREDAEIDVVKTAA